MSGICYVIVSPETTPGRLVAAAAALRRMLVAIVVGDESAARGAADLGVDEVVWFACPENVPAEAFAPAVAQAVAAAPGVLISGRDPASRVLVGAAAAAVSAPVVTGVLESVAEGGLTLVTTGVYGGIARRSVDYAGPVALLLDDGPVPATAPATITAPVAATRAEPLAMEILRTVASGRSAAELGSATRVVGVGRGLKARADLALVEGLATALDAELGCTRPLAEGLEWVAKDRYIGISGQHIAPRLYLAVGVSGQLQHMAGVRQAGTIVAINTDAAAPIARDADYLLVGDLYQLVPAITSVLGGGDPW
jgi:electron transfer flavoprotein alpha subunit